MKKCLLSIALLLPLSLIAQSLAQVKQNRAVAEREEIEKLQTAWNHFADALLQQDTNSLKALAAACIKCENCPESVDSSHIIQTGEEPYGARLIPFNQFLAVYGPYIFDARTMMRLKDQTKLHFIDNGYNAELYVAPCIQTSSGLKSPQYKEVLLTFVDSSGEFEGAQHAFAFIETKEGYKFCGYSTIP